MKTIDRETARRLSLRRYFTGRPCSRGHVSPRLVSTRACMACASEANKRWRANNPGKMYEAVKLWRSRNSAKARAQDARRRESDQYRIAKSVSTAISKAMRSRKSGRSWESIVGYSLSDLTAHMERQFTPGMTFENYGEWHIDHIVPRNDFCLDDDEQIRACWALTNLRPIWAAENCSKRHSRIFLI